MQNDTAFTRNILECVHTIQKYSADRGGRGETGYFMIFFKLVLDRNSDCQEGPPSAPQLGHVPDTACTVQYTYCNAQDVCIPLSENH